MASTYSTNLRLELIGTGEQQGTWGTTTNTNLGTLLEEAIGGYVSVTVSNSGDTTLTTANGAADQARNMTLNLTGTISAERNVIVPSAEKIYIVKNSTTGGYAVTVKVSGQTGVSVPNGTTMLVYVDGTDVRLVSQFPVPITLGGTGAATAAAAATSLGLGTGDSPQFAGVNVGNASDTTITRSSAGVIAVEGVTVPLNSTTNIHTAQQYEIGNASDTTLTRVSAGVAAIEGKNIALNGTSETLTTGTIQLGNASDTTLTRVSAGVIAVEGKKVVTEDASGNAAITGMVVPASSFLRNRIINGDMRIDQRNAGASVTPTDSSYTLDRWRSAATAASKYSIQQSSTAPTGHINSMIVTSLSAYSVVSTDVLAQYQSIEGMNMSDLGWGAAGAQSVTLSFCVRSSLTGTFGGAISNSAQNRSYPFTYAINSANTWEQKTVTIPGDTTGTWLTTNGVGMMVRFGIGVGSTFSGTASTWAAANYWSATGATSVVGTNGATWYITGVQLEPGTVATPFERRQYGQELALCQRYYQAGLARLRGTQASGVLESTMLFPVTMRATPTMTGTDISALSSATLLISTTLNSTGNVSWTASSEL